MAGPAPGRTGREVAIIPFDQLSAWKDPAVAKRLGWYLDVAENRKPAKFRIARTIPVALSLADAPEDALWDELDRLTPVFVERLARIRETGEAPGTPPPHLLDLCRELAYRMLAHCNFCRWNCRVDRTRGTKFGTCKLASDTRVSTYFHHRGEELDGDEAVKEYAQQLGREKKDRRIREAFEQVDTFGETLERVQESRTRVDHLFMRLDDVKAAVERLWSMVPNADIAESQAASSDKHE